MSLVVALLLAAGAVAYVVYPLLQAQRPAGLPALAAAGEILVADGVAFRTKEEWALDQALGKAGGDEPDATLGPMLGEAEAEIEKRVAAIVAQRKKARAGSRRTVCPECGKAFQSGDHFCARCGEPHPNTCLRCGERQRAGDRFCTRCGAPLPGGAA